MLASQFSFEENLRLANMGRYPNFSFLPQHKNLPDFIDRFGIDFDRQIANFSGGQRQILAILMSLQKDVSILLLDEPTSALDIYNSKLVMEFLHDLVTTTNLTILIICHDKELVDTYASDGFFNIDQDEKSGLRTISCTRAVLRK